jgi:hypothetical protein
MMPMRPRLRPLPVLFARLAVLGGLLLAAAPTQRAAAQTCEISDCGVACSEDCGMTCAVQGPADHVLISEVLYNTPNEEEWVELYNPTDEVVIIDRWTLDDGQIANPGGNEGAWQIVTHHPRANFGIAPGGFVVIAQNADVFYENHCFYPDFALIVGNSSAWPVTPLFTSTFLLNNNRDEVYLRDEDGQVVDAMAWAASFQSDPGDECRGSPEEENEPLRWPLRRMTGAYQSAIRYDPANPSGPPSMTGHQAGGDPLQEELISVWTHVRTRQVADSEDGSHCAPDDLGTGIAHAGPDTGGLIVFPYVGGLTETSAPAGTGSLSLTVQGKAFDPGATVSFSGDGIHIRKTEWLSTEAINVVIDIRPSATPGLRDVTVARPDGFGDTAAGLFEVTPHQIRVANRVVISEMSIDPEGGDARDQWIELHNPTGEFVILDGWTLSDGIATLTLPDLVPGQADLIFVPGGSVVVAVDGERFADAYGFPPDFAIDPGATGAWPAAESGGTFALLSENGRVYLRDAGGVLIDAVGWGDEQPDGEDQIQFPLFFTAPTGETLLRIERHDEGLAQGGRLNERLVEAWESSDRIPDDPGAGPETGGLQAIPIIDEVTPAEAEQDSQGIALVVTGRNFEPSAALSITDTGITFQSSTVVSSTRIEAILDVDLSAPASLRDVVVTNPGGYQGRLPGGFRVIQPVPVIVSVTPDSVFQGDRTVALTIVGEKTHFTAGDSQILIGDGTGYAVASIVVEDASRLEATVTFLLDMAPGLKDVRVSTAAWNESAVGPQMLEVRPLPRIAAISPDGGNQDASLTVTISGQYTDFEQEAPQVDFGPDVAVTQVTVIDATTLTADVEIGRFASLGLRDVTVTTGAEIARTPEPAFEIRPRPAVLTVTPQSAEQGDTLYMSLEGINTSWIQGTTVADLGEGVTVRSLTVNGPTSAVAEVRIDLEADPGPRDVVLTTGDEIADLPDGFTVHGKPRVVSLDPDVVVQGDTGVTLQIAGAHTSWTDDSLVAFGDVGVEVVSVTATGPATLSVVVDVAESAPTGLRDILVTTGDETALGTGALRVVAPTYVASVSPARAPQGAEPTVEVLGANTGFEEGLSSVAFGEGITVTGVQVTSRTRLLASLVIDQDAAVGPRDVIVTTGSEVAEGTGTFTVDPFPYLEAVSPGGGMQGTVVEVIVTGVDTTFDAGSFASFGAGVAVLAVEARSETELWAELAVATAAAPGPRDVVVVTGSEAARGAGLFEVIQRPRLLSVEPDSGETGESLTVTVLGEATHFEDGVTTADFGPDIGVTGITVESPVRLVADLVIGGKAAEGLRDVTVTTGGETVTRIDGFEVVLRPRIARITPSTAGQGAALTVEVEGRGTSFEAGEVSLDLGDGILVENVRVSGRLRFVADVSVADDAAPGSRDVTVESGDRLLVLEDGFNVRPTARIVSVTPGEGRRGDGLSVSLSGVNTTWGAGSQAVFGEGVTVTDTVCASETACEVFLSIHEHARLGTRDVTVLTGVETAFGAGVFEVLARAEILSVFPESVVQGQSVVPVTVAITGARISGEDQALSFGDGIVVTGIEVAADLRSATALLSVDPEARIGTRDVTVRTVEAGTLVAPGALRVEGRPRIVDVLPAHVVQGAESTLDVLGHRTGFVEDVSFVDLGDGLALVMTEVVGAEHLRITVQVDPEAVLGPRDVVVTTGGQVAIGEGLLTVLAEDPNGPPAQVAESGCGCASGAGSGGAMGLWLLAGAGWLLGSRRRRRARMTRRG